MKKTEHQSRIETFMRSAGQNVPDQPTMPDAKARYLRMRLIMEEALETAEALGFEIMCPRDSYGRLLDVLKADKLEYREVEPDLVEIADGCADVSVVTIGTLSACGISDKPLLEEVDKNNLAKVGPGSYKDAAGKLKKPPGHKPPDIKSVLDNQRKDNATTTTTEGQLRPEDVCS